MITVLKVEDTAFPITVEQHEDKAKSFRVTYGLQVDDGLCYSDAARTFGLCYFHALAFEGKLDNEGV